MKRYISLLIAAMLCTALCACGNSNSSSEANDYSASPDSAIYADKAPAASVASPDEVHTEPAKEQTELSEDQLVACEKAAQAYVNLLYPRKSIDNYYEHQDEYLENFYKSSFFWAFYKNDLRYNCFKDLRDWISEQDLPVCDKTGFSIKVKSFKPVSKNELDYIITGLSDDGVDSKNVSDAMHVEFNVEISYHDAEGPHTATIGSEENMLILSSGRWYLYKDMISANHVRTDEDTGAPVSDVFHFRNYDLILSNGDFNDFNDFNDYGDYGEKDEEETIEDDLYVRNH